MILLDEPDSNLNPKLAKLLINLIKDKIVTKGVQVIMTTHNPVTVNMMEEKSLFMMRRDSDGRSIIEPVKSKKEAVNFLTGDLVTVNDVFGVVLTESKDDQEFYQKINDILCVEGKLQSNPPLIFKECSKKTKKNPEGNDEGGKSKVQHWVRIMRDSGLDDFIYGIIDSDKLGEKQGNKSESGIVVLKDRHSLENYMSDPVAIFISLMVLQKKNGSYNEIVEKLKIKDEKHPIVNCINFRERLESLKSLNDKQLQSLVCIIFEIASEKLQSYKREAIIEFDDKKLDGVIESIGNKGKWLAVKFVNDHKLLYPECMFKTRGHDLKRCLSLAFEPETGYKRKKGKDYLSHKAILQGFCHFPMIPNDLMETFVELQTEVKKDTNMDIEDEKKDDIGITEFILDNPGTTITTAGVALGVAGACVSKSCNRL